MPLPAGGNADLPPRPPNDFGARFGLRSEPLQLQRRRQSRVMRREQKVSRFVHRQLATMPPSVQMTD
jgi:hypothetical protein